MGLSDGAGVFLGDEIRQSSNPAAHADGIAANMFLHKIHWAAVQINELGAEQDMRLLREACQRRGFGAVGSWCQGLDAQIELDRARNYGSQFHIANVESPHDDQLWRQQDLDRAAVSYPHGLFGVIFTEGAWGRDPTKSLRWREAGAVAIPEAIQSENPQATVLAMLDLAIVLGFPAVLTAPCVYLTRGYPASNYNKEIPLTLGRWSVFRYGDIDQVDWDQIHQWPRPAAVPPAPPPPPPSGDPVYGELERLVGLFRSGSPNIAKAFDEVERLLKLHDARLVELEAEVDDLNGRIEAARAALAP